MIVCPMRVELLVHSLGLASLVQLDPVCSTLIVIFPDWVSEIHTAQLQYTNGLVRDKELKCQLFSF